MRFSYHEVFICLQIPLFMLTVLWSKYFKNLVKYISNVAWLRVSSRSYWITNYVGKPREYYSRNIFTPYRETLSTTPIINKIIKITIELSAYCLGIMSAQAVHMKCLLKEVKHLHYIPGIFKKYFHILHAKLNLFPVFNMS